jgi:hypothetical protein
MQGRRPHGTLVSADESQVVEKLTGKKIWFAIGRVSRPAETVRHVGAWGSA